MIFFSFFQWGKKGVVGRIQANGVKVSVKKVKLPNLTQTQSLNLISYFLSESPYTYRGIWLNYWLYRTLLNYYLRMLDLSLWKFLQHYVKILFSLTTLLISFAYLDTMLCIVSWLLNRTFNLYSKTNPFKINIREIPFTQLMEMDLFFRRW